MRLVRVAIVIFWLPVMISAACSRLFREVPAAFWFAWNDMCIEQDEMRRTWRANSFNPEDWK
ncbi:hypothetical protein EOA60_00150 [Mesorhizobium sp. M1A.F.Ca.IN.020.06.1.1]|uniref:hypothetical protein n=1 Tax=unclassified Mesorhizobium TaxID=325217 RepID=UPI000FCC501C|nr:MULTISPECIES: hypothetical protein [unclassified Mesorhizobium]RUV88833.1 hypothetical protein EOA51_05795 [Mesorhizobium sp. M1A.F.Ca.IN.020.32.1.1]RUW13148.1 hypothetical protein EOA46_07210 [Mesorhizobium sp. M1A.F.Ca.IN.022.05.2.1]RUW37920.1 hypothetical protein EOA60_00150 [Mesorhizobium sp. M1A.F.Ca.IN.020.06.1.1]RWF83626.1 MAG: hypothetical protein EOQ35_05845 [Mesorhizobium sp.]RWG06005.1 MAG: hypothetical protein EOQ38_02375 [Mesorhizobium sp.]